LRKARNSLAVLCGASSPQTGAINVYGAAVHDHFDGDYVQTGGFLAGGGDHAIRT
jgi:hypothetical protein